MHELIGRHFGPCVYKGEQNTPKEETANHQCERTLDESYFVEGKKCSTRTIEKLIEKNTGNKKKKERGNFYKSLTQKSTLDELFWIKPVGWKNEIKSSQ